MNKLSLENPLQTKFAANIENVVATANLNQTIDLKKIMSVFPLSKYDPVKFPGVVIRQKNTRTVLLIFKSGSVVCTGTKSEAMAENAIKQFVSKIQSYVATIILSKIKIENMVASANFENKIHLELAARKLPRSLYEPEQFPGIIHRLCDPKTVVLIFASGKLVCTGAKSSSEISLSINSVKIELEKQNLFF